MNRILKSYLDELCTAIPDRAWNQHALVPLSGGTLTRKQYQNQKSSQIRPTKFKVWNQTTGIIITTCQSLPHQVRLCLYSIHSQNSCACRPKYILVIYFFVSVLLLVLLQNGVYWNLLVNVHCYQHSRAVLTQVNWKIWITNYMCSLAEPYQHGSVQLHIHCCMKKRACDYCKNVQVHRVTGKVIGLPGRNMLFWPLYSFCNLHQLLDGFIPHIPKVFASF